MVNTPHSTVHLQLPDELWLEIGRLAIDVNPFVMNRLTYETDHQPSITRTCRFLRVELLPYFYANCDVIHLMTYCHVPRIGRFLHAVGPDHSALLPGIIIDVLATEIRPVKSRLSKMLQFEDEEFEIEQLSFSQANAPAGSLFQYGTAATSRQRFQIWF